ncbi:MAG: class V aminotransferase [Deltaproteobacteria bacterium GWC2_42_51]|nr:MAG: class V aminotransferase [Deltaproteobacteria bacterium GWA2_42_85]OGP33562.1 MAG: class V aminotransferase [Deltaproteobacteria bacterium GWC2_42_51]OGP40868.1 MAG: class V aminotransferase [Deltaproteobacteria bacterium GWD2_42_10]OGP46867.1 MAG: class V aminotransferase [Deltaproteobacteria bacterium GWF2_42_12]OGQ25798.1 MAG: class V aminotransferase [Deltaproteobacteria bacterium RIFCSPHIGHO2_02_FULL_42_44]OGQ37769.1 MAG: class V aminotransferase [Deltaproteobacteria bacterium RIF
MRKTYLLAPGPTPVPDNALLAMAQPMIHHRTPQFSAMFAEVKEDLKYLFQTKQDVLILAASGTGAMEGSITNLFSPGDEVLVINGGKFGERWGKISEAFGLKAHIINVEWGKAVDPKGVKKILDANPKIKGVLVQASETSTTVAHPIKELAAFTKNRQDCVLIVDGITSVGVFPTPMDDWGIDVLVSGSQKAFMLPPGLAFASLSEKAWKFMETAKCPRFYFDFKKERKNLKDNTTAYTPAVSLIIGLREALKMIKAEGLENVFARHSRLARATRAAIKALGLKLLAPDSPSDASTGAYVPEGVDGGKFVKYLRDDMGVTMAGGQDHLKGKIIRIAHLGYVDNFDIIVAISSIEMALRKFGHKIEFGKGVAAAQEILMEGYK